MLESSKCLELLKIHNKCTKCGNEDIQVEIHGNLFKRTCKCGWSIEVKED